MAGKPVPFGFDREFAPDGTVLRDGERIKRVFNEAEVKAKTEAAADAARQDEAVKAGQAAAEALKQISARMQVVLGRMDAESGAIREDAARLAVAAARAIAGRALEAHGEETIMDCAREALADLRAEPRLAVRVAPDLADAVAEGLIAEAERMGFEGAVSVRPDPDVAAGDCALEWRAGSIERTAADIEARIGALVDKWLAAPAADATKAEGEAA